MSVQPNFFIVGAPKSGTTSLHQYLAEHPEVCVSNPKEPGFWAKDFSSPLFCSTSEAYARCFSSYRGQTRVGESSTCYLYSRVAAKNIHHQLPNAKIIAMIRNPITMVSALHAQYLKMGFENIACLSDALSAENDRANGERLPSKFPFPKEFLLYRRVASYSKQIERYQDLFGQENVMVILYEDFSSETSTVFEEVCNFLEISTEFKPELARHNKGQIPRFVKLQRFARRATQVELPNVLKRFRQVTRLFESGKANLLQAVSRFNLREGTRKLDDPTLHELEYYFENEISSLERMLGRHLDCWKIASSNVPKRTCA